MKRIFNLLIYSFIIIIQIVLLINYNKYYYLKRELKIESKSIEYTINKQINPNTKEDIVIKEINTKEKIIEYDMVLEIPQINLKKGILKKNDKNNNITKNVTILKESSYPNTTGNIFLIAHSGTSKRSFFRNINKLNNNDEAYLYYKGVKYKYEVNSKYEINKNNNIRIKTSNKNNLFLITCSQKDKSKYLVIELKKTDN